MVEFGPTFSGEFEHIVDGKGRLTIPANYRDAFSEGMYVTRGLDGCLFVLTPEDFQALRQHLGGLSIARENVRLMSRLLLSGAECTLDKQGRILLPAPLRKYAGIENDIVVVGLDSRLEIWSRDRWQALTERLATDSTVIAEGLAELGLL